MTYVLLEPLSSSDAMRMRRLYLPLSAPRFRNMNMQQQNLPDPAHLASTLASNQAKVGQYIRTLTGHLDKLVSSTIR